MKLVIPRYNGNFYVISVPKYTTTPYTGIWTFHLFLLMFAIWVQMVSLIYYFAELNLHIQSNKLGTTLNILNVLFDLFAFATMTALDKYFNRRD